MFTSKKPHMTSEQQQLCFIKLFLQLSWMSMCIGEQKYITEYIVAFCKYRLLTTIFYSLISQYMIRFNYWLVLSTSIQVLGHACNATY